jgi:hypothetical protein
MSKSLSNVNINKPFTQDNARTGKGENTADQASRKDTSKRASAVRDSIINNNNSKNSTIYAGRGDDVINNNNSENSTIYAGRGDDVINNNNSENETIYAGRGDDVINNNNSENSTIYAGRGDDVINTDTLGSNTIKAGRGDDVVNVSVEMGSRTNPNGTLTINGGAGHDKVILSGKREDYEIDKKGNYVHIDTGSRIKINDDVEEVKFQEASTNNSASTTSRTNQGKIKALQQGLDKYFDVLNTSAGEATLIQDPDALTAARQNAEFTKQYKSDFTNVWDKNKDGSLDTTEVTQFGWKAEDWNKHVLKHDKSGDGKLNFDELLGVWREFDTDKSGKLEGTATTGEMGVYVRGDYKKISSQDPDALTAARQNAEFTKQYKSDFTKVWDKNKDGSLNTTEVTSFGWKAEDWNKHVLEHDKSGDGKLNFDELLGVWREFDTDKSGKLEGVFGKDATTTTGEMGVYWRGDYDSTMSLTSRLDKMGNELKKIGPIKMNYDDFVGANEGAFSPVTYAARTDSLQQLSSDVLVDLENQMSAALAIDTDAGRQSVANLRTEMKTTAQQFKLDNGASELMNGLINKVQIDFGNIDKEQAKSLYQINLENLVEAEVKYSQGIATGNFEERRGVLPQITALGEMRTTQHVISELERQYGFKRQDLLPERALQAEFIVELNNDALADLKNQMSESLTIDSEAGRISSAALRIEINLVKKDKDFWSNRADYWSGDDTSAPKVNVTDTMPVRAAQAEFFVELNNDILYDLNTQMSAALAIDTEAGRLSAASLRTEIATTKSLLGFWQSAATYWSGS